MLPNFLIVGAPKAATTWLADCLREHPQVFIPPAKELRYFCGAQYGKGIAWYRQQFDAVRDEIAIGEASPSYLGSAEAPQRIRELLPDARLILSLRHPVEQAYSFYWHLMSRGELPRDMSFARFFAERRPRASHYGHHVSRYLEHFRPDQLLVLVYENEVQADPARGLRRCQQFLGIDASHTPASLRERRNAARDLSILQRPMQAIRRGVNRLPDELRREIKRVGKAALAVLPARQKHAPLDPDLRRQLLREHCLSDLGRLQQVFGLDLSAWYER